MMDLRQVPPGIVDWAQLDDEVLVGEQGTAAQRARRFQDIQLRRVDYGPGYVADHWCAKGHILFVVAGALVIEYQDGASDKLSAGMSWHVGEGAAPPHRVVCLGGAQVFIVD